MVPTCPHRAGCEADWAGQRQDPEARRSGFEQRRYPPRFLSLGNPLLGKPRERPYTEIKEEDV